MNREDIIRMAREACVQAPREDWNSTAWVFGEETLERFAALVAALVAAAEREKVARWQIGSGYSTGHGDTVEDLLVELEWQVRESEREACAKVCETLGVHPALNVYGGGPDWYKHGKDCADAIRSRRNA